MKKRTIAMLVGALLVIGLAGCGLGDIAGIQDYINTLKGQLVGNDYTITEYDNFGSLVFTAHGDKIVMSGEVDDQGEPTSYIDITIDGYDWKHVGATLMFAQGGVDIITDFQIPADMSVDQPGSTGFMPADRYINEYKNFFGKSMVVLVSSQNGTPICLLQGDDCYVTFPNDLPKTTRIHIDGKSVYVHRADVDIFPVEMFK